MRSDAANLLNRLGQTKFRYQEFSDSFADMELWPLFEALIRDPRISGGTSDASAPALTTAQPAPSRAVSPPATDARNDGLFGRYAQAAPAAPPRAAPPGDDVRSLLRQLNDRVASGQL